MGITREGEVYKFASHNIPAPGEEDSTFSEFAGPTFSPDGKTFFVNIQSPGLTFAIWGPFERYATGTSGTGGGGMSRRGGSLRNPLRQRQTAAASPPAHLAPAISGELMEAADTFGLSHLEAAAYDRLGVIGRAAGPTSRLARPLV